MSGAGAPSPERILDSLTTLPAEPGVVAVYVFGSVAEGRMHHESDVDVGVLLDRRVHGTPRDRFEAKLRLASELGRRAGGRTVDVVVLDDAPPGLARRIVTRGRLVACADPALERSFRRDAQLRAADLDPFLRRTRERKIEALGR